jgi:hypothetical protein
MMATGGGYFEGVPAEGLAADFDQVGWRGLVLT